MSINSKVMQLQKNIHSRECMDFIEEHEGFVLSKVSKKLNRYIYSANEEAYSIGLSAFLEAIESYNESKGSFYNFAIVVIDRRLSNFLMRGEKFSYDAIDNMEIEDHHMSFEEQFILKAELSKFEKSLEEFGITIDKLVDVTPKHLDTKKKAKEIGIKTSEQEDLTEHLYTKKRLPISMMCNRFQVSRKIINRSKFFITSIIVVFTEGFDEIKKWI